MKKIKTSGFKFIKTAEFMDDCRIRFNVDKFKFRDDHDCCIFANEMCEILSYKFNRTIQAQHLIIQYYCIDYDFLKDCRNCGFHCLSYVHKEILSVVYDPIFGMLFIETE